MKRPNKKVAIATLTTAIGLLLTAQPAVAVDYFWQNPGEGNWNVGSNWDQGLPPEAQWEEAAIINNGGTAIVNSAVADAGGLILGQAAGQSGTLRVLSGGSLNLVDSTGTPQGIANIGLGGTGVLDVQGGGTFSTTSLDVNVGSNVTIGGGAGVASVTSTGNTWLGGTTTVRGPGHTFTVAGNAVLEGSGVYNPVISAATQTRLRATGTITLGGALDVDFAPSYTPAVGNSWTLMDATAITGNFANVQNGVVPVAGDSAPQLGSAYRLRTVNGGDNGRVLQLSLEGNLVLRVNRDTGELTIRNPLGASVTGLDSYAVTSPVGSLLPGYKGISGAPAGDSGWQKATLNSTTGLAELKATGGLNVSSPLTNLSLGTGFSKTAVASQGLGVHGEDLTFTYRSLGGELVVGQVEYVGTEFLNDIALIVNATTGQATLKNDTLQSIAIDGYSILSSTGALNSGTWTGLGASMANWVKSPASSSAALTETNPVAPTALTAGQSVSLGAIGAFSTEAAQNGLSMKFLVGDEQTFRFATIKFVSGAAQPGDFNGNGVVDGADFLAWQRGQSPTPLSASDLAVWKSNYGAGSTTAAAAAVPEPATFGLASLAAALLVGTRRRRSTITNPRQEQRMQTRVTPLLAALVIIAAWSGRATAAVQLNFSAAQPTVDSYDQAQLLDDAAIPGGTSPGGGTYNQQAYTDNAGPPGQTFTPPADKHLYALTAISVKGVGDAGGGSLDTGTWSLEISKVNGTQLVALKTFTGITIPTAGAASDWVTISLTGLDVPTLEPNSLYAFELFTSTGWFGIDATQSDSAYAGGTAFNSNGPGRSFAGNTLGNLAERGYDRTFIAQLTAPPGGPGDVSNNGVVDVADFNIMNANFEKAVPMFTGGDLDGNSYVDLNDFARWRNAAPPSALIAAGFAVPEPSTAALAAAAILGSLAIGRRRRRPSEAVQMKTFPLNVELHRATAFPLGLIALAAVCLGAPASQAAVTMTIGATAPTPGPHDQYTLLDDAMIPGGTAPGGGTYNSQAFSDNNGPPGQIFTTPASVSASLPAFALDAIWLKGAEASGGNFGGFSGATTWAIRISEVTGTLLTPLKTVTGIPTAAGITGNEWFKWTFTGGELQTLKANTQYAFDIYSSAGWLGFDADSSDSYAGGTAFNSGGGGARSFAGVTTGDLASHGYDRTFLTALTPSLLVGPGDVDSDGDTDLNDYAIIRANLLLATGATRAQGDLTGDGRVWLDDFAIWKNSVEPSLLSQIPEPSGAALFCVATGCLCGVRRAVRRRLPVR
jgi:hypothetical protein